MMNGRGFVVVSLALLLLVCAAQWLAY